MNYISLFYKVAHSLWIRGTGRFHPHETAIINENLSCIRQNDVNIWFYRKGKTVIAIDAGYHLNGEYEGDFQRLCLAEEDIQGVFLTHGDPEHIGGLLSDPRFAPNADVYLHEEEEELILGQGIRKSIGPLHLKNPVCYEGDYRLFQDEDVFDIGGIEVKCYHIPGHTPGHSAFLVEDTYLFTGDSIAINHEGGHSFFSLYNMDTEENIQSLLWLKEEMKEQKIQFIATAHHGLCNVEAGFSHIEEVAYASRQNPFDPMAPYDVFRSSQK